MTVDAEDDLDAARGAWILVCATGIGVIDSRPVFLPDIQRFDISIHRHHEGRSHKHIHPVSVVVVELKLCVEVSSPPQPPPPPFAAPHLVLPETAKRIGEIGGPQRYYPPVVSSSPTLIYP